METNSIWKSSFAASKALLKFLEGLPEEQRDALITGKAKVVFEIQNVAAGTKEPTNWNPLELVTKLNEFSVREEAEAWIGEAALTKRQFQETLRSIDVPWDKSDNVERLREKLIENTIGFKLRSRAIQGT